MQQQEKPPYVRFTVKAVEDRIASQEAGHYVTKDVDYVQVTPRGSKDLYEAEVNDYFQRLTDAVRQGRFMQGWLEDIKAGYRAWKEGQEIPENGTSLRNWPLLSPAQLATLISISIRTVEDLAQANEETVARIGMGGRALKLKAEEWLRASQDGGKAAEKITALELALTSERAKNDALAKAVAEMQEQLKALKK